MNETIAYFKQQILEAKDVAIMQWQAFMVAVAVIAGFYAMSVAFDPGWMSYLFIVPPAIIVAITALARVNDIGPERQGRRWETRKIGLILAGVGGVMLLGTPFSEDATFPTWRIVVLAWGFALTWLTTPEMPPWDYYITGKYRFLTHDPKAMNPGKPRSPIHRVAIHLKGEMTPEELMKAQEDWEAQQRRQESRNTAYRAKERQRRGDGDGP